MSAIFKIHLKTLVLKKAVEIGEIITQKEIQAQTGLSLPTISRWLGGELDRIDAETVGKLTKYLECEMSDLVTIQSE